MRSLRRAPAAVLGAVPVCPEYQVRKVAQMWPHAPIDTVPPARAIPTRRRTRASTAAGRSESDRRGSRKRDPVRTRLLPLSAIQGEYFNQITAKKLVTNLVKGYHRIR